MLLLVCVLLNAQFALAESSKESDKLESQVRKLIVEKNDYPAALKVYAKAARSNMENPYFKQQYSILRRVIKMKRAMATENSEKKWMSYYQAIRSYYYASGYYKESVKLDEVAYGKFKTDELLLNLFETSVILEDNEKTSALINKAGDELKKNTKFCVLKLLLKARSGDISISKADLEKYKSRIKSNPESLVYIAGLYLKQNDPKNAFECIALALENTIPTQMSTTRNLAYSLAVFKSVAKSEGFKQVLRTESKVKISDCTGGGDCSTCSLKNNCSGD